MARKNNSNRPAEASGSIHFDTATKTVMADTQHDTVYVKEKVNAVREVVPGKSNNEVVLVLQYYDYNVEKAIQAYLEDGATEALGEWNFMKIKQPKKRKNKKKGAGDKNVAAAEPAVENGSTDLPVVDGKPEVVNGDIPNGIAEPSHSTDVVQNGGTSTTHTDNKTSTTHTDNSAPLASLPQTATASQSSVKMPEPRPQRQSHGKKSHGHHDSHHHSGRERTYSELSTASSVGDTGHRTFLQGLEKAFKDLQRQTNSLERLRHLLDHEIDRSYKSVKSVFEELRKGLNSRESQLIVEMDSLKKEASEMIEMRQSRASQLKVMCERSEQLKETEVQELRADIKHFVIERRHDEELGRTTRFLYDSDLLLGEIKKFGAVVPVKSMYTTRRPSTSSVASSSVSQDVSQEVEVRAPASPTTEADCDMQSPEMLELTERLRTNLRLPGGNVKHSNSDHTTARNGGTDRDHNHNKSNPRHRQTYGNSSAKQSDPNRSPRQKPRPRSSYQDQAARTSSSPGTTTSPGSDTATAPQSGGRGGGRGRGRGRGSRGGGYGRGQQDRGQDSAGRERSGGRGGQTRVVVSSIKE